jgi:hypothetical protein
MISQATVSSRLEIQKTIPDLRRKVMLSHLSGESSFRQLFIDLFQNTSASVNAPDAFPKMAEILAKQTSVNLETIVSASMIVLSHSTADDVFTAACGLSIDLSPEKWESELNLQRTVSLQDVFDKGTEAIKVSELASLKNRLGNKSLPNRAALLFERVPIRLHKDIPNDESSYYRESRLVEVDKLRHKIVHEGKLQGLTLQEGVDATHFLHEAAHTAIRSIIFEFGLPFDFKLFGELVGAPRV